MKFFERGCASQDEVLGEIGRRRVNDIKFRSGRSFGLTYQASSELDRLCAHVFAAFSVENAFSPIAAPSIRDFQSDILEITTQLMHGNSDVAGSVTSGGTESLLMAVRTAKAIAGRGGSVVGPSTAHPAIRKACELLSLHWIEVPVASDLRVSPAAFANALRGDTILAVGSAPSYPWGMVDDITAFAASAAARQIPFHVDACIGGYILPFLEQLGYPLPLWDFRVPGVTSISADLHKFGYAPRGTSVILHRPGRNLAHQRFAFDDWAGGSYSTQALLGSRPAAPLAAAWAVMRYLGADGYRQLARKAMEARGRLFTGLEALPELFVVGEPEATVVAIGSRSGDALGIAENLRRGGWYVQQQQRPRALHLMISAGNLESMDEFVMALASAVTGPKPVAVALQPYGDGELVADGLPFPKKSIV